MSEEILSKKTFNNELNTSIKSPFIKKKSLPDNLGKPKEPRISIKIDKLVKILVKGLIHRAFPGEFEEEDPDPHFEKYLIIQNKTFLENAKKYFSNNHKKKSKLKSKNQDYEDLITYAINIIKSSNINIEESEKVFDFLYNLNPFSSNLMKIKNDSDAYAKLLMKLIYTFKYENHKKDYLIYRFDDTSCTK